MPAEIWADYRLIRSRRKTLALEVEEGGGVLVRAPFRLPSNVIERFVLDHAAWIKKHQAKARVTPPEVSLETETQLRSRALCLLPALVTRYATLLGVRPLGVRVTSARKRFGSASSKGRLCFSWRLMRYPLPAVEYVVAHEVAHLKQLNHSPAFYAILEGMMPDYRQRAALLKLPPPPVGETSQGGKQCTGL